MIARAPLRAPWLPALLYGLGGLFCLYLFSLGINEDGGGFCTLLYSDCLAVTGSEYGALFTFPVASFGAAYFALQLGLVATGRPALKSGNGFPWFTLLPANLMAAAGSLYFIYVMRVILKEDCVVCYGVHLINFLSLALITTLLFQQKRAARSPAGRPFLSPLLLGLAVFLGLNLFAAQQQVAREQEKHAENLQYFQYLYRTGPMAVFSISPRDRIIGDCEEAVHQILLIYKEGCGHCKQARQKLSRVVQAHPQDIYLVLKNYQDFPRDRLNALGISKVPAVFINGKKAEGWDIPGFLDEFTQGCGC